MRPTGSSSVSAFKTGSTSFRDSQWRDDQEEALDQTFIADLLNEQIRQMTREELIRVIQATNPPILSPTCQRRLSYFDRTTLERLVFLSRYCCQNRRSRSVLPSRKGCHARFNTQKKSADSDL